MLAQIEARLAGPTPAEPRVVAKLRDIEIHAPPRRCDFEFHLDVVRNVAAKQAVAHLAGGKLLFHALGEAVEHRRIQFVPDQIHQVGLEPGTELLGLFRLIAAILQERSLPTLTEYAYRVDGITGVHIDIGILCSTEEQAAKEQAAEPGVFHAARNGTRNSMYKLLEIGRMM
jgi:hypothetical protein